MQGSNRWRFRATVLVALILLGGRLWQQQFDGPIRAAGHGYADRHAECSQRQHASAECLNRRHPSLASGGTFCVAIYDIGFVMQDETYSITVVHLQ